MLIFFNMPPPPQFYGSYPSVLHHTSTPTLHIYSFKYIHNYSAKLLAQRRISTTSQVVPKTKKKPPCLVPFKLPIYLSIYLFVYLPPLSPPISLPTTAKNNKLSSPKLKLSPSASSSSQLICYQLIFQAMPAIIPST